MIIFDLDGTLADCEHRRHFIDPIKAGCLKWVNIETGKSRYGTEYKDSVFQEFKPDWQSFYETCDKDEPIYPVISIFQQIDPYINEIAIWSGRCESVKEKTKEWLVKHVFMGNFISMDQIELRMRPIGDYTPDDELKERWLDEIVRENRTVDFVFDDRPKVVRMWRKRGIFVFNCSQHEREF